MARKPRTEEEIEIVKQNILDKSLELINEDGYNNFTMRKLAKKLNMTATPIYQYYNNKDELYLAVLTQSFENLYEIILNAYDSGNNPMDRLKSVGREYIKFGIDNANAYNIMLVLDVPKFYDYVGTPTEHIAFLELEAALKVIDFGKKVIKESGLIKKELPTTSMATFQLLCAMHGFISFVNNKVADYILKPKLEKVNDEKVSDEIIEQFIDTAILQFKTLFQ
ncbi:MAG: TetR/AcrR family transcriptional regulator [Tissierellia bacterium]|jgi:AcrR family transcriptional regulator|nr:TetR/AcrR family transcriptional regulator [Tissierellia bacterium]